MTPDASHDCPACGWPMSRVESQSDAQEGRTGDPTYPATLLPEYACWVCLCCGRVEREVCGGKCGEFC